MEEKEKLLSEEHLDFLREMMNVGAGNAATALSTMLQCGVDLRIPWVHVLAAPQVPPQVLDDPSLPVTCVKMRMIGKVTGDLFFIVQDDQKISLIRLAERASGIRNSEFGVQNSKQKTPQSAISNQKSPVDISVLAEIGNILAGVYLTAVHDFCKLNIYHTVPRVAIDMIQSLLDESLATMSSAVNEIIMIQNDFIIAEEDITTLFLMIPSPQSIKTLVDSIEETLRGMMMGRQGEMARNEDQKEEG